VCRYRKFQLFDPGSTNIRNFQIFQDSSPYVYGFATEIADQLELWFISVLFFCLDLPLHRAFGDISHHFWSDLKNNFNVEFIKFWMDEWGTGIRGLMRGMANWQPPQR